MMKLNTSPRSVGPAFLTFMTLLTLLALPSVEAKHRISMAAVPQVSPDGSFIVFAWAGDLWRVPIKGGDAQKLTEHKANEMWPRLSPDGKEVVFTSNRKGKNHLYVVSSEGGPVEQIGWHSEGYTPEDWSPDGKRVLVSAWRDGVGVVSERMFWIERGERKAERMLFDAYGDHGRVSPDGKSVLFVREDGTLYRQGYQGTRSQQVWRHDFESGKFTLLCDHPGGNRSPMWKPDGSGFYFLSQKNAPCFNLWSHDFASGDEKQLTFFDDANVILPALSRDGSTVVFRQMADFWRFDPRGEDAKPQVIEIFANTDGLEPLIRRRWYSSVWNNDAGGSLAWTSSKDEMVFTAGGDLWVMDTVFRQPKRICEGRALHHETEVIMGPDDKAIYWLRDSGIGVNVMKATKTDSKLEWWEQEAFKVEAITNDDVTRWNFDLSPDGKRMSFTKNGTVLVTTNMRGKDERKVVDCVGKMYYSWAPDSKWLSATIKDSWDNYDVWILSADASREPYNISRHPGYDMGAVWSPDGAKIAYYSERGLDEELDIRWVYMRASDEERYSEEDKLVRAKAEGAKDRTKNIPIEIDFDGLHERVHTISNPGSRDYGVFWSHDGKQLAFRGSVGGKSGTYRVTFPTLGSPSLLSSKTGTGAKWTSQGIFWIVDNKPHKSDTRYDFKVYQETHIEEYRRLAFRMIWRNLRDRFYDADMNGKDWNAMREKYEDIAAKARHWSPFGRTVSMLEGELNASHTGFRQSYKEWKRWDFNEWELDTGHLGLRFDPTAGPLPDGEVGVRVDSVIPGSPSDRVASRVLPGEYLVSVNGQAVKPDMDLTEVLNDRSDQLTRITIAKETGETRTLTVIPESYSDVRKRVKEARRDRNAETVSDLSDGKMAYIHVDQMNWEKFNRFEHEVFSMAYGKEGLIVDVRNNSGGFTADRMLDILCAPKHAMTIPRGGELSYPLGYRTYLPFHQPVVVLCNQYTGSNGEIFTHAIQTLKRGKVVGVPTQGAVVSMPKEDILDIGSLSIPRRGWFIGTTGHDMEEDGAVPDVVLWPEPGDIPAGIDTQLDTAVELLAEEIKAAKDAPRPAPVRAWQLRKDSDRDDPSPGKAEKEKTDPGVSKANEPEAGSGS